jgi:hypothetical protein
MPALRRAAARVHSGWLDTPLTTAVVTAWIGRAVEANRRTLVAVDLEA